MDVWAGAIELNEESQLRCLRLIDRTSNWQTDISRDSTLAFRCFVNPALIPLYARAGPNLELHTTDIETAQWLKSKLLGNIWLEEEELDRFQTFQCPVGFLISVNDTSMIKASGPITTDLLVYGVLSNATSFKRPPTPPVSSSPDAHEDIPQAIKQELRIYATPLSASLITKAQALPSPQNPDELAGDGQFAEFLPDLRSPSPKRKRVATLFETVVQHHKRVRQKGGEAVSQLMAKSSTQSSQQLQPLRIKRESEEPVLPALDRIASQRSRSVSLGSGLNPFKPSDLRTEHPRLSSNRSHVRASRWNTPNPTLESSTRKEQSPALLSSGGKVEPSSTPKDAEAIILDNKNTITRTILTCMRLYGFNRTTRSGSSCKNVPGANDMSFSTEMGPASNTDEDEFKAMYHGTYRASTFALRKYLKEPSKSDGGSTNLPPSLEKAKAMTYIDEFLRLFCEDN